MEQKGKDLRTMMFAFANKYGESPLDVMNGLLDYIIGFFDPLGNPIEGWKYDKEQNKLFHEMFFEYANEMREGLAENEWRDLWGDLFMNLQVKGGGKQQFFTPTSLVELMTKTAMQGKPIAEKKHDCGTFGKRIVISDPTCGSSRNLLSAAAYTVKESGEKPYLCGEDLDRMCCKMSAVNMAVHGFFGEVVCHNTLTQSKEVLEGYIINETMYPFPTKIPSIRRCNDPQKFYITKKT